jgi:hypothetical protein
MTGLMYTKRYESQAEDPEVKRLDEEEAIKKYKELFNNNLESFEKELLTTIKDEGCQNLIKGVFNRWGHMIAESVGSAKHHHADVGELLPHMREVFRMSQVIGTAYKNDVKMDPMLTAAALHDIGKIFGYTEKPDNKRKVNGSLRPKQPFTSSEHSATLGHFGDGLWMIGEVLRKDDTGLSIEDERLIYHIIASHHGEQRFGWGSIVSPATPEAYIVFLADYLDSREFKEIK